jgi:hypothetical protein
MTTNIFESAKEKVMPEWAKFINAGDSVQGTYIGKITGQVDGYGNEQVIYQLLQEDGKTVNVGFGLNKKVLHQDMAPVKFGQIVGFRYKGTVKVKDKRSGNMVEVKDFALHQDPKIVNEAWLKENAGDMPEVVKVSQNVTGPTPRKVDGSENIDDVANDFNKATSGDVPFSSAGSLTNEDKLAVIEKLAKDKLGSTSAQDTKDKVMTSTGIAFIPVNYGKIIEALSKI